MKIEKKDYTISDIYQGGVSAFKPTPLMYGNYPIKTGSLGLTTDPRNANLLQEVSAKLASGVKHLEIEAISPEYLDSIPKQHLKEVQRLSKLTGVDVSVHGPVIDTSGIGRNGFSEVDRELAERKVFQTLQQSHELEPEGNIIVNFHSAEGIPASQYDMTKQGKVARRLVAVNRETGQAVPLEEEKMFHAGGEIRESIINPHERLKLLNDTEWDNSLFQVEMNRERAQKIIENVPSIVIGRYLDLQNGKLDEKSLSAEEYDEIRRIGSAYEFIRQARRTADTLFSRAYEFAKADGNEKVMHALENFSEEYGKKIGVDKGEIVDPYKFINPIYNIEVLQDMVGTLHRATPRTYAPIEEFALEKSSATYGNAAFESYKKFKDKSPVLVIENPPAGFALSTGEDIANIVKQSREQFVKKAVSEGISRSEAEKQSEKLIGATWDVGHINMLRKFGYSEEDIIAESKKVAPYLKHVHLSDNFGFEHTELPMGMGNVPLKEIMEKLGKKGVEASKIIEAAQWWQHFKSSPFQISVETMGPPIYSTKVAPYWNQAVGLSQDYFGGYGLMLPQINYETFGAGFSQLPADLGGSRPGAQGSRMSGRQME